MTVYLNWGVLIVVVKAIPLQAWTGSQEVEAPKFQDTQHMKVVRLSALCTGHLYPQEIFRVLVSVRCWDNSRVIVWPEGLCQRKIPMTPSEIKPATFQLVAQCLNQLCRCVSPDYGGALQIFLDCYSYLWLLLWHDGKWFSFFVNCAVLDEGSCTRFSPGKKALCYCKIVHYTNQCTPPAHLLVGGLSVSIHIGTFMPKFGNGNNSFSGMFSTCEMSCILEPTS